MYKFLQLPDTNVEIDKWIEKRKKNDVSNDKQGNLKERKFLLI